MVRSQTSLILILFIVSCLGVLLLESSNRVFRRTYDHYVLDNRNHYLPCRRWPRQSEVEKVVIEHQEIIQQIENVNPGNAGVEIDRIACPGKADLVIWYATHQNKLAIEQIIGDETFYGVPYRLQNR